MKVSFDFDGTLDRESVQKYAKELIDRGIEVWIVTARPESIIHKNWNNEDLFAVADELGIPKERIVFMAYTDKYEFFIDKDFIWHLDDDYMELQLINRKCVKGRGISCYMNSTWRHKCEKLLKQHE